MRILIVTPAPANSRYGNRVTALRWSRILKEDGHRVSVQQSYWDEQIDLLIALHARRSFDSISRAYQTHPETPIVVTLTGTDVYGDLSPGTRALKSLEIATRIVALQPKAIDELPPSLKRKTRVIYQSVRKRKTVERRRSSEDKKSAADGGSSKSLHEGSRTFDVCVVGHLRPVKDPFRAALASRKLPESSRIRVVHVGGAMSEKAAAWAEAEMKANPRYRWLGDQPAWRVRQILEHSRLFVLSSKSEGGANALGEAIVAGLPVLASRIPGSTGILGERYPGYFDVGDTGELAVLMNRAETDSKFLAKLVSHCHRLAPLFDPAREHVAWAKLLEEIR
jgi:putative glycosyltransferase (TIGR04348 family)